LTSAAFHGFSSGTDANNPSASDGDEFEKKYKIYLFKKMLKNIKGFTLE